MVPGAAVCMSLCPSDSEGVFLPRVSGPRRPRGRRQRGAGLVWTATALHRVRGRPPKPARAGAPPSHWLWQIHSSRIN